MIREIKCKRLLRDKTTGKVNWEYQKISPLEDVVNELTALFFIKQIQEESTLEWVSPILEFSGLVINGVDIYESDKGSNEVAEWEIVFNKGCFCAKRIDGPESDTHVALRAIVGFKYTGNIYEDKFKK